MLLVGGLPLTVFGTAIAFQPGAAQPLLQLAQLEGTCPEGQTCLTDEQKKQQRKEKRQQKKQSGQEAAPAGEATPEATDASQDQKKRRNNKQQAQDQAPAAEEAAPTEATGGKDRKKRRDQAQGQQGDQGAQSSEDQATGIEGTSTDEGGATTDNKDRKKRRQDQAKGQQQEQNDATAVESTGDAVPEETTVDKQLEAQGDKEQAKKVRDLRKRMLRDLGKAENTGTNEDGSKRRRAKPYDDRDVVDRRDDRVIINLNGRIIVRPVVPDDASRLLYAADNVEVQQLDNGRTRTLVHRANGVTIITTRDRFGNIIRRVKRLPNGTEVLLIDNRFPNGYDPRRPPIVVNLPPVKVSIPPSRYIVDLGGASYDDVRGALLAPPVQALPRPYTLDEVLWNENVRAYSPRIDLDTITFEFGSSTIGVDQMGSLSELGKAMADVLREHPDEVYLIEGHTDAVGSDDDNLILSDERAEAVATALSQNFDIPPENLITQGYGEQYLKVNTSGPERQNRRATVRRVTELLQAENTAN